MTSAVQDPIYQLYAGGGKELYDTYPPESYERLVHDCFLRNGSRFSLKLVSPFIPSNEKIHRHAQAEHFLRACYTGEIHITPMHQGREEKKQLPRTVRADYSFGSPLDRELGNLFLEHKLLQQISESIMPEHEELFVADVFIKAWQACLADLERQDLLKHFK